jgi:hypothetical protein
VRPDGTRALKLGDRGMVYSVATRAPDGTLKEHCVGGAAAAAQAVRTPALPREDGHEHE